MILGLHIRDSVNAGDRASSPLDYFAFPDAVPADMRNPPEVTPDAVIYGGGSITASPHFIRMGKTIAWGVGHHERKEPWEEAMFREHRRASSLCDLYFPRDEIQGFEQVPCASCMHPVFDEVIEPVFKEVRYSANRRVSVDDGRAPHRTNEDGPIEDAVRFLASGETVITSSYHGAYWAGLLGRKVKVVPWGSKFSYLPRMEFKECREANRKAYQKVLAVLNG